MVLWSRNRSTIIVVFFKLFLFTRWRVRSSSTDFPGARQSATTDVVLHRYHTQSKKNESPRPVLFTTDHSIYYTTNGESGFILIDLSVYLYPDRLLCTIVQHGMIRF
jgi:hypothetical protein